MLTRIPAVISVCLFAAAGLNAQTITEPAGVQPSGDIQRVIERLDRLERQNQTLIAEIAELRRQLAPAQPAAVSEAAANPASQPHGDGEPTANNPAPAERLDVQESRTDELAQTKVGTSSRMPVTLTGMVLFNAFHNGGYGGSAQTPGQAQLNRVAASTGASFRQTIVGLTFYGPNLPGGGKASGSAYFDFWGGTASPANNLFHIRTATLDLRWKNTTITAGQDKPIISPREPFSLAEVGVAPLVGAGNLWDWQPQVRIEQRFVLRHEDGTAGGDDTETGLRVQAGVVETAEVYPSTAPAALSGSLERQRPAYEGRALFYHGSGKKRLELAPGVHASVSHVAGQSVNSRLSTLDWLVKPSGLFEFSGAFFRGTDAAGLGALRQGFTILANGAAVPVHSAGVWSQLAVFPASRISLHIFGGEEAARASDLPNNGIRRNAVYAGNIIYKLAPNVLAALEVSQTRTDYISSGLRLNNHYDLALAYLF